MPKDGIQRVGFDELVLRAAGIELDRERRRASTSTATETSQREPLGQPCGRTRAAASPARRRASAPPTVIVSQGIDGHHSCTARITATTRAAPASIDRA